MEQRNNQLERQTNSLQSYAQTELSESNKENKISIYGTGKVTAECFAVNTSLIKKAKPKLSNGWYDVLQIMIDKEGFTNKRYEDAVQVMIATCPYPEPAPAEILSYDKQIDAYLWDDLLKITKDYSPESRKIFLENYVRVVHYGQERYVLKEEAIKYKLELWKKPEKKIHEITISKESNSLISEPDNNLTAENLAKSLSIQPPVVSRKMFSREEREKRKKEFEVILEEEKKSNQQSKE